MSVESTGTMGAITTQADQFIEGAPVIRLQQRLAGVNLLNNPDSDGFYYGMSATAAAPIYEWNCYTDVSLTEDLTVNDIQCDRQGNAGTIRKRNKLRLTLQLKSLLPLSTVQMALKLTGLVATTDYQKAGIGVLTNNSSDYWRIWLPKVYEPATGKWIGIQLHKAITVEAFTLDFTAGQPWMTQVTVDAYADDDMPDNQKFATIIHHDQDIN